MKSRAQPSKNSQTATVDTFGGDYHRFDSDFQRDRLTPVKGSRKPSKASKPARKKPT